jgi:hypothetical protein
LRPLAGVEGALGGFFREAYEGIWERVVGCWRAGRTGFLTASEFDEEGSFGHEGVVEDGGEGSFDCSAVFALVLGEPALVDEGADLGSVEGDGDADEALLTAGAMQAGSRGREEVFVFHRGRSYRGLLADGTGAGERLGEFLLRLDRLAVCATQTT